MVRLIVERWSRVYSYGGHGNCAPPFGNFSRFYQMGRLIPDSWFCFDSTLIPMIPVRFPWFRFDSQRNNLFDSMIPTWFHWFRLDSDLIPLIPTWFHWFSSDSLDSDLIPVIPLWFLDSRPKCTWFRQWSAPRITCYM